MKHSSNKRHPGSSPIPIGQWVVNIFLMTLPLVNIVYFFLWLFSRHNKKDSFSSEKAISLAILASYTLFLIILIVTLAIIKR